MQEGWHGAHLGEGQPEAIALAVDRYAIAEAVFAVFDPAADIVQVGRA